MAHKKGLGSSRHDRDSDPKRLGVLGVKAFAGQEHGARLHAGRGLRRDRTVAARQEGAIERHGRRFALSTATGAG